MGRLDRPSQRDPRPDGRRSARARSRAAVLEPQHRARAAARRRRADRRVRRTRAGGRQRRLAARRQRAGALPGVRRNRTVPERGHDRVGRQLHALVGKRHAETRTARGGPVLRRLARARGTTAPLARPIGPHAGHAPVRVDAAAGRGADVGQLRQRTLRRRTGPRSPRSSTRSTSAAPGRSASRRRAAAGSPTSAWSVSARARRPSSAPARRPRRRRPALRRSRRRRSPPSRPSGPARSDAPNTGSCARSPVPAAARPRPSDPRSYGHR